MYLNIIELSRTLITLVISLNEIFKVNSLQHQEFELVRKSEWI